MRRSIDLLFSGETVFVAEDKRGYRRFPLLLNVEWEGASGRYQAHTTDISIDGCFVDTLGAVVEGEMVHLKVFLNDKDVITLKGFVAHAFPNVGFGLHFVDLSAEEYSRLVILLARYA